MNSIKYPNYEKFFQTPYNAPKDTVEFIWLGQAGFAFRYNDTSLIIDPYLSDFLAKKYKGGVYPHQRMMDIPIDPIAIQNLDVILSTHPHSDHMDPETLPKLVKTNPNVSIIIPGPTREEAIKRGALSKNITLAYSKLPIQFNEDIEIIPIPAAHEELRTDDNGDHFYLGYIIKFGDKTLYHSGDCVPYEGLTSLISNHQVDIAFLPINGRDEIRHSNNIAGNFLIPEVFELCNNASIPRLVVHHFGMFAYNTVTKEQLEYIKTQSTAELQITIPSIYQKYRI